MAKPAILSEVIEPMEARTAEDLPAGLGWWFEPKWEGFRCLAFRDGGEIRLPAKSGKSLNRFFPEVVDHLLSIADDPFVTDGELLIRTGDRHSFEALQMRLHPSESRIRKLASETPASLTLFDMLLSPKGENLQGRPLSDLHGELNAFATSLAPDSPVIVTPGTPDREIAAEWLGGGAYEGVVA